MENGKERKQKESVNRDPLWEANEAIDVSNRLALPSDLKKYLNDQGMDFRFLNASAFRDAGNIHHSDWRPFDVRKASTLKMSIPTTAEGLIQRGDLILGIRPKTVSMKHRELLNRKNKAYSQGNVAKTHAKELKERVRDRGLSEHVAIDDSEDSSDEGYS